MCFPLDPTCLVGGVTDVATGSAFQSIANSTGQAAGDFLVSSLTWWVSTPSVDPTDSVITTLQARTIPLVVIIMMASVLVQAIRMIITRKKDPLVTVGTGLLRYFLVNALGITLIAGALKASDALSSWLVAQSMNDFATHMQGLLSAAVLSNPFALFALGAVGFLLAVIQWLLGFLRQAGILVLAVMLPLAASGSLTTSTRVWLNRMLPWMVSLIVYKPCAALIYSVGFSFMAGQDLSTVLTGIMILILAVIAMPTLLKFFSWGGTEIGKRSAGGGGGMMGAVGAMSLAGSSGGASSVTQASYMDAQMPQTAAPSGASMSGGGASVGPEGAGPAGAAEGGTAAGAGAGAAEGGAAGGAAAGGAAAGAAAAAPPVAGAMVASQAAQAGYQAAQGAASDLSSNPTTGE